MRECYRYLVPKITWQWLRNTASARLTSGQWWRGVVENRVCWASRRLGHAAGEAEKRRSPPSPPFSTRQLINSSKSMTSPAKRTENCSLVFYGVLAPVSHSINMCLRVMTLIFTNLPLDHTTPHPCCRLLCRENAEVLCDTGMLTRLFGDGEGARFSLFPIA